MKPRITKVGYVYFEAPAAEPLYQSGKCSRLRESADAYRRHLSATPEWQQVGTGWVKKPALIAIHNDGDFLALEVKFGEDGQIWEVPPDDTFCGFPRDIKPIYIRSAGADIPFTLIALP